MSLQVWLPLTGDVHNQGLSDITFNASGTTINSSGKIGSCYSLNGSNSYVEATHDKTMWNNKEITFATWFKSDQSKTTGVIIEIAADLTLNYTYNSTGIRFGFWRSYLNSSNTRAGDYNTGSTYYDASKWHHIAITFAGAINKLYVDGELSQTWDSSNKYTINFSPLLGSGYNRLSIGLTRGSTNYAGGLINDVRIYDEALSPKQIKLLSQGLVLHYPLNRNGFGQENLISGSDFNGVSEKKTITSGTEGGFTYTPTEPIVANTQYTVSCQLRGNANMNLYKLCTGGNEVVNWINRDQLSTTEYKPFYITFTSPSNKTLNQIYICTRYGTSNTQIGDWFEIKPYSLKLEKGSIATPWCPNSSDALADKLGLNNSIEYDVSGYKNNGTITGELTYSSDTPKYNTSTTFDGNVYIRANRPVAVPCSQFTVCGWVNLIQGYATNNGYHLFTFGDTYGRICVSKDGAALRALFTYNGTNSTMSSTKAASEISAGVWNFYAFTFDNGAIKMYINGVLDNLGTSSLTAVNSANNYIQLGTHATEYPKAKASDFRFYTTALSADDILELYNTPVHLTSNGALLTSGELTEV